MREGCGITYRAEPSLTVGLMPGMSTTHSLRAAETLNIAKRHRQFQIKH
jgi:hypothetical protein